MGGDVTYGRGCDVWVGEGDESGKKEMPPRHQSLQIIPHPAVTWAMMRRTGDEGRDQTVTW
jgi:hypothetical protein